MGRPLLYFVHEVGEAEKDYHVHMVRKQFPPLFTGVEKTGDSVPSTDPCSTIGYPAIPPSRSRSEHNSGLDQLTRFNIHAAAVFSSLTASTDSRRSSGFCI
jgi:hypothetical protein